MEESTAYSLLSGWLGVKLKIQKKIKVNLHRRILVMNVGIVSIVDYENMGNRLQNYALQVTLLKYVDDVYTIRNKQARSNGIKDRMRNSALADKVWLNNLLKREKRAQLLSFSNKHIKSNPKCYWYNRECTELEGKDQFDVYCAGSDQVWNPDGDRTGMFNFLGFADREQTFSYAASFGVDEIPEEHKAAVRKGLQHIKYISVREDAGKRIVEELTGRTDVEVLVDPTMLLTTQEWDKILRAPKAKVPEKYILTYFLGPVSPERRKAIQDKATKMGCTLIEVMDKNSPFYAIGPDQFVYLIKHAQLVCTDSFHGSVFSFLYQRRLAVFDRDGSGSNMGSRIDTFASKFHLESCRVKGNALPEEIPQPDYSQGYQALVLEREKSKRFLDKVFHKE